MIWLAMMSERALPTPFSTTCMWFYDGCRVSKLYGIAKYGWTRPRPVQQDVASRGLNNPTCGLCGSAHMHRRCLVYTQFIILD